MDHREELITLGTQDEDKQNKNTICVGQHYTQDKDTQNTTQHNMSWTSLCANKLTNNVNKTWILLKLFFFYLHCVFICTIPYSQMVHFVYPDWMLCKHATFQYPRRCRHVLFPLVNILFLWCCGFYLDCNFVNIKPCCGYRVERIGTTVEHEALWGPYTDHLIKVWL